jgi:hypothetical protein
LGAENIEDAFLADGVGVHQDVVEDEHLGFIGREFLGDCQPEAEEELFLGALRQVVEGVDGITSATDAGDLEVFIQEDFAVADAGEFGEGIPAE